MGRLPYFIAKRYFLAKHSKHAVGLLSKIAIGAVAVATFSLFLVLFVFFQKSLGNKEQLLQQIQYHNFQNQLELN